tara:strand:- start:488 stop:712 length:225 start_codon:yes stop_codon:yes gene_type:complete
VGHEVLDTWEFDGRHHVIPSRGKKKGQSIASFGHKWKAEAYARARSATFLYTEKARDKVKKHKKKRRKTLLTDY